jgi:hypothetical protein
MDPGLYGFAAIVSVPIFLLFYAMGHILRKEWRQTREKEKTAERPSLDRQLERLLNRAEAHELSLEESARRLEEKVDELDRIRAEHGRRLENLEAVVVGQAWNAAGAPGSVEAGGLPRPAGTRPHEGAETPKDKKLTRKQIRDRTARLARRLDR